MTPLGLDSLKPEVFRRRSFGLNWLDRLLSALLWLTAFVFVAGLVHLVSIFALPELAKKDAYARLAAFAQPGELTLLPQARPGQEYAPFVDPALVQGVCLFDLNQGPLELSADIVSDGLLSFSFRTRTGRVFYSMTDRAASHGKIDVVILTPKQLEAVEATDDEEELPQELRLTPPQKTGFVLINALVAFPGERPDVEARVKAMNCDIDEELGK